MSSKPEPPGEDPILTGLNPVQGEAVLHGEGPLLVLAGAGSGKTRVLTRRIVHLVLRREVPAERILAVTFTNKAAGQMRSRVESLLGYDAAGLWIGTFHSICLRLLRRHADRLGFARGITVFDQDDQAALLKQVLKDHGSEAETPRLHDLQSVLSLAKNRLWDPDDLEHHLRRPDRHRLAALYREYQARLFAQGGADFDDLLGLAVRLLEDHPDLGDAYARKFLHILVDEYQDTNHVQLRLVRRLAQGHGNVMVVGDDDQSIYRWRGADITNILEFERHFPQARVLRMTQNYRSTHAILDAANAVVKHNRGRREKALWTENPPGDRPVLFLAEDEEEEAARVVGRIQHGARARTLRYGEAAILYRVHAQSRPLEEACLNLGVPYVLVGGVVFYQRREVKDLLAYLKLAANPLDEVSFARALGAPSRGIGEVGLKRIAGAARAQGGGLSLACAELTAESGLRGRALQRAREFGELIRDLAGRIPEGPEPLLRSALERTGYLDWLRESGERDWEDRQANVVELLEGAGRFQGANPEGSVEAYLDQIALYTNLDLRELGAERVTLMTVHNAKGLEFPHVFITGLEEGLFPHASAFDDPEEMEEERRLFYVAATRAMRSLHLSASMDRRLLNRLGVIRVSRFVEEIPAGLLEESPGPPRMAGLPLSPGRVWSRRGSVRDQSKHEGGGADGEHEIRRESAPWVGRQVRHAIFGVGRVESQDGEGEGARLSVIFPQVGRKKIVARFLQTLS